MASKKNNPTHEAALEQFKAQQQPETLAKLNAEDVDRLDKATAKAPELPAAQVLHAQAYQAIMLLESIDRSLKAIVAMLPPSVERVVIPGVTVCKCAAWIGPRDGVPGHECRLPFPHEGPHQ